MRKLDIHARTQFNEIFQQLGISLDITEDQYKKIVRSYEAMGKWLSAPDSNLARYNPEIIPQGSFMLGTMIPPSNGKDELDIDLVCRLMDKEFGWTQYDLKKLVGDRLKANGTYLRMLDEEGRRCWTISYSDAARYHMDILPALVDSSYLAAFERALAIDDLKLAQQLAIRITDREEDNYETARDLYEWPKSNPFGYAIWFYNLARVQLSKSYSLREAIQAIPPYQKEKFPLQTAVQILKWHRDQRFIGDIEKPISIIITTLAARAYERQIDLSEALTGIAVKLGNIEERYDEKRRRNIKWIPNPVNPVENFADKWPENPELERKFFQWVNWLQEDLDNILSQVGNGLHAVQNAMKKPFGERIINSTFNRMGDRSRIIRENGGLKMSAFSGTLGDTGRAVVTNHTNYGSND